MKIEFEKLKEKYGQVDFKNGITLALVQNPYLDGNDDGPYYEASAIDESTNDYIVTWAIIRESEDESDCCDWEKPNKVRKL